MITFSKDLLNLNPVYNNSVIEFSSTVQNLLKAKISINEKDYIVYPIQNKFYFNLKEIAKSLFEQNRFEDKIIPDLENDFIYSDDSILKTMQVKITALSSDNNSESVEKNYKFIKAVNQLPFYNKRIKIENDLKLLLPTKDFVDYEIKYFEGYPFDFSVNGIGFGDEYYFKNISTTNVSETYESSDDSIKRIFLSDGATNTTIDDVLILNSALNRIELWKNDEFKCNINIRKIESDCGIYLKWANSQGGYSYWKFDRIWTESTNVKTIGEVDGDFDNLQNTYKTDSIIGKTATTSININSTVDNVDRDYLNDLLISPTVQMYIHTSPFNKIGDYDFINVKITDGNFLTANNKQSKSKINLTVQLPELNSMTL